MYRTFGLAYKNNLKFVEKQKQNMKKMSTHNYIFILHIGFSLAVCYIRCPPTVILCDVEAAVRCNVRNVCFRFEKCPRFCDVFGRFEEAHEARDAAVRMSEEEQLQRQFRRS